jgi:DNA excision repair protein ERCC-2
MSIQFDYQGRTLTLSVRDLCGPEWCGGSLNLLPLSGARNELGQVLHESHQSRQEKLHPGYRKEQTIRFRIRYRDYSVLIQGRVDGVYERNHQTIIEEIKSILSLQEDFRLENLPESYFLQLRIYLYLWSQVHEVKNVVGNLVVISCEDQEIATVKVESDPETVHYFIQDQIERIILDSESSYRRKAGQSSLDGTIHFPFSQMRRHQDTMIKVIGSALQNRQHLLVSAPTGIGKTVAALYGSLQFAVKNGLSIFFLTSKTTQQRIVVDTLRLLTSKSSSTVPASNESSTPFNSLILRSKEKSCANDVMCCHEVRCPYARNFFGKLDHSGLRSSFTNVPVITPELVYSRAVDAEVCPFELSLELVPQVHVTVCDYNYVYDPRVSIEGLSGLDPSRIILIVDEAHNLYSRAREYYSPELDLQRIRILKQHALSSTDGFELPLQQSLAENGQAPTQTRSLSTDFLKELSDFVSGIEDYVEELGELFPEIQENPQAVISFDREFFREQKNALDELMQRYLIEQRRRGRWQDEDQILDFFYAFARFCDVLELAGDEFVHVLDISAHPPRLKIICLDPSGQLKKINRKYYSVLAMSATLTPLEFYSDVLGFDRNSRTLSLPSPFPSENRKILVIPEVSTTFRQRDKHIARIARIIEDVIAVHRGNYFAFFPSFDFMDLVAQHLSLSDYKVLVQSRIMADHNRNALLEKLSVQGEAHLVLSVQGGIFAEGVDYPGELAIGAFVVGPGLPKVSFETELIRRYYEENCSKGFEYAFLYPGMNRVVQSAGRIIRTEKDQGILILLDRRFSYENYMSLFPRDWYESSPQELISKNYLEELRKFWNSRK